MRLIDADALKASIDDNWNIDMMVSEIWSVIDHAPTIGGWISVKDRLPEKQTPVLVYVPPHISGQDEYIGYVGMAYHTELGGGWWAGTDGAVYGAIGFIHEPTHWMPLPEPPEEVTDDDVRD